MKNIPMETEPPLLLNPKPFKLNSCSFLSYDLSPVISLSFNPTLSLLSVARETTNTIETYQYPSFSLIMTHHLNCSDLISRILFHKTRGTLLVICKNSLFYELTLESLSPLQVISIPGGAINDFSLNPFNSELLLASNDGSLKIYEFQEDSERLGYSKTIRNFKFSVLSCIWDDIDPTVCYGSYENGLVRKFDRILNVALVMDLGSNAKKKVFAWKIACLANNLLCGCSDGSVAFFETKFGTLIKKVNVHKADILAMVVNKKGNVIFVSGSDSKVISIELMSNKESDKEDWVVTSQERGQSHDVYCLELINEELLVSGGLTTDLCLYQLKENRFIERMVVHESQRDKRENTLKLRHITALQHKEAIQVIESSKNLILYRRGFGLELWEMVPETNEFRFLIEIKNKENAIISAKLSFCGTFLVYSTLYSVNLFHLFEDKLEKLTEIEDFGASCLGFSTDSNSLYLVSVKSQFYQYDIQTKNLSLISTLKEKSCFEQMEVSLEEEFVAIGSKGKNLIVIYKEKELYYEIPKIINAKYTVFKFNSLNEKLCVVYDNNKFAVFNMKERCLDKWSWKHMNSFPLNYVKNLNTIVGIVFHPEKPNRLILFSNFYYILVNMEEKIPKKARKIKFEDCRMVKNPGNFDIVVRKFPILHMESYNGNEFILFQNSWNQMLKNMPGAINTKKFGN